MAHSSQLAEWLLDQADRLNLQAHQYKWPERWAPGFFDFLVTIEIGGTRFVGSGLADSEDLAFVKAGAEALERYIHSTTGKPNSNGLAVHVDKASATENAARELLERDAFFCHFLTSTRLSQMQRPITLGSKFDLEHLQRCLAAHRVGFALREMVVPAGLTGVVCAVTGISAPKPFGIRLGLGCAESMEDAAIHAIFEMLKRSINLIENRRQKRLSLKQFSALISPSVEDHDALGLDILGSEAMRNLLIPLDQELRHPATTKDMRFQEIPLPSEIRSAPIVAVLAESSSMQGAFFGHTKPDIVNMERLQHFVGHKLSWDDLNTLPHVFG